MPMLPSSSTTSYSWKRTIQYSNLDNMSRPNLFNSLVKEAAIQSKQSGERGLSARSVKKVTRDTLTKFKG
ncbi:hypothetical protein KAF25_000541 [Fusarium avenaceum]|uniref:Uncharacterized protein n=1 Tax=Fusarium avenaceum TaxID=40199 RepID=A0A9P7KRK3_9HYPO|nr:hypothetical protein KAF25_000541 [Fusarium avenaceum]